MIYVTYVTKIKVCPKWKESIPIQAKYKMSDDFQNPYEAKFMFAICPILENLRLPYQKRNKTYDLFAYCDVKDCAILNDFPKTIDVRKT